MPEQDSDDLSNIGVLVTRPAHQARSLVLRIEAHGGHAILLPTIEIEATDSEAMRAVLRQLPKFEFAIFISVNAVEQGLARLDDLHLPLPSRLRLACVGPASATALKKAGYNVDIEPAEKFDSESLLAQQGLQAVAGKRIVIFRGTGGRELLAQTLRERGAEVVYAECYRRRRPQTDTRAIERDWSRGKVVVVVVTSGEGLQNLFDMLSDSGKQLLLQTPVITVSERTQLAAQALGVKNVRVTMDASDLAIVEELKTWRRKQKAL
ncbi:MAG: uroporphyrinogen-III synthase [Acidiferrobacterales bacterium]